MQSLDTRGRCFFKYPATGDYGGEQLRATLAQNSYNAIRAGSPRPAIGTDAIGACEQDLRDFSSECLEMDARAILQNVSMVGTLDSLQHFLDELSRCVGWGTRRAPHSMPIKSQFLRHANESVYDVGLKDLEKTVRCDQRVYRAALARAQQPQCTRVQLINSRRKRKKKARISKLSND